MLPNVSCPCVGSWARTLLPAATAGALSRIAARVTRREAAKRRFILRNAVVLALNLIVSSATM